jgi:hypothetical protein
VGYAAYVYKAARDPVPASFEHFEYAPLERSLLTAKFEVIELPSRLLGGGDPVEVTLSERELNALLFGDAGHSPRRKSRVVIEGDKLRFEDARPASDNDPRAEFFNTSVRVRLEIDEAGAQIQVIGGTVGDYELGAILRRVLQNKLQEKFTERRDRDTRLARIRTLKVINDRVEITYDPKRD